MSAFLRLVLGVLLAGTLSLQPAMAVALAFSDRVDGISCSDFDVAARIAWDGGKPTRTDAKGVFQGRDPHAVQTIDAADPRRVWRWDVTALARSWGNGLRRNDGLLLMALSGGGVQFHSREEPDKTLRPALSLKFDDGVSTLVEPVADASLDCSTRSGLGQLPTLRVTDTSPIALRFDLTALRRGKADAIRSAELILVRTAQMPAGTTRIGAFGLASPLGTLVPLREDGLARAFPADRGITGHPDVLYADGFDNGRFGEGWIGANQTRTAIVDSDEAHLFTPLSGKALRVTIPKGGNLGLDLRYKFKPRHGDEPDELYFRYYLRLSDDWLTAPDGGKLPGFGGTYGLAGWGGRPWDGNKGWSMRGSFGKPIAKGHAAAGKVLAGTYAYHSEADLTYGEVLPWVGSEGAGLLEVNRWYCIEQHVKLNTLRKKDGVLQVWIDGRLALDRGNLRIRDLPNIHIEEVWMNFYHGGIDPAVADMTAFVDAVVIARRYIGPLRP